MTQDRVLGGMSAENAAAIDRAAALALSRGGELEAEWRRMTAPQLRELVRGFRSVRGMEVRQHYVDALHSRLMEECLTECGYVRDDSTWRS